MKSKVNSLKAIIDLTSQIFGFENPNNEIFLQADYQYLSNSKVRLTHYIIDEHQFIEVAYTDDFREYSPKQYSFDSLNEFLLNIFEWEIERQCRLEADKLSTPSDKNPENVIEFANKFAACCSAHRKKIHKQIHIRLMLSPIFWFHTNRARFKTSLLNSLISKK